MTAGNGTAGARRGELEYRTDRDMLRDTLGEFGEGWEIRPPEMWGEPWTAHPRRKGLPYVVGADLAELRTRLETAAAAAGLAGQLALEAEFAAWHVWRSVDDKGNPGAWWASRRGVLTQRMNECGLHATVGDVRTAAGLRVLLAEQVTLAEWAAGHDWQVPGDRARRELGLPREASEFRLAGARGAA